MGQGANACPGRPWPYCFQGYYIKSRGEHVNEQAEQEPGGNEQAEQEPGGTGEPGANLFVGGGRRCWRR